jgi:hypothetical protein
MFIEWNVNSNDIQNYNCIIKFSFQIHKQTQPTCLSFVRYVVQNFWIALQSAKIIVSLNLKKKMFSQVKQLWCFMVATLRLLQTVT